MMIAAIVWLDRLSMLLRRVWNMQKTNKQAHVIIIASLSMWHDQHWFPLESIFFISPRSDSTEIMHSFGPFAVVRSSNSWEGSCIDWWLPGICGSVVIALAAQVGDHMVTTVSFAISPQPIASFGRPTQIFVGGAWGTRLLHTIKYCIDFMKL